MENSLNLLLGFAEAAEEYMKENGGKALEGLENIDLSNLKKYLTDSIGSFDSEKDGKSEKFGQLVFKQYLNEKQKPVVEKPTKKNVIEELGQIFDVSFDDEVQNEKQVKLKIDDLLANYETEYVDEEVPAEKVKEVVQTLEEPVKEEQVEEKVIEEKAEEINKEDALETSVEEAESLEVSVEEVVTEEEIAPEDFEAVINDIIGIKEDTENPLYFGEIFHSVKKPESNPVVKEIIEDNDEFVETTVESINEIIEENVGSFKLVKEETKKETSQEEVLTSEEIAKIATETIVDIASAYVGEFEVIEEDFEENQKVVDEIKDVFENISKDFSSDEKEEIIIEQEENDFGIDENDEILKAIRKAAGFSENEDVEEKNETPIFQPAPDELDSLFEEVETNKEGPFEETTPEVEYKPMSQEDLLKSLSGLINYGQFDEILKDDEEFENKQEPQREAHYILNPLIKEQEELDHQKEVEETIKESSEKELPQEATEHYILSDEQEEDLKEITEEVTPEEEIIDEETLNSPAYEVSAEELALRFIENPGLDVIFNGDDIIYSSYDEQNKEESIEEIKEETETLEKIENQKITKEESLDVSEEVKAQEEIQGPLDENDQYVDNLLNGYEYKNSQFEEILDAKQEIYKIITKMYPYLSYAFIKSAYDLKDSIADEYEEGKELIILHRATFKELEDLRKYAELMMVHEYQVNVDENQMIIDTLKNYKNADGLILNSIFEVANQINFIGGVYEGYCVLTNDDL